MNRNQLDRERRGLIRSMDRNLPSNQSESFAMPILESAESKGYRQDSRVRLRSVGHGGYRALKQHQRNCSMVKKSVDRSRLYKDFVVSSSKKSVGSKDRLHQPKDGSERVRVWVDGTLSEAGFEKQVSQRIRRRTSIQVDSRATMKVHAIGISEKSGLNERSRPVLKWYDRSSVQLDTVRSDYQTLKQAQTSVTNVYSMILSKVCHSLNRKAYRSLNLATGNHVMQHLNRMAHGRVEQKKEEQHKKA